MDEMTKLKYWLDSEVTMIHVLLYVIIAIQLGDSRWRYVMYALIFTSIVYALRRMLVLPRNYLKVKHKMEQ